MPKRVETLETARELANRVASVLPGRRAEVEPPEQVQVPEPIKSEALNMDNLYLSVKKVNEFLPSMVDSLLTEFFGMNREIEEDDEGRQVVVCVPRACTNDRRRIFETLAKFSLTDARLEKEFGLMRDLAKSNGGSINLQQFNITQIRSVPGAVDKKLREIAEEEQ